MSRPVGVIVGRFQVARLTDGHTKMIRTALDECKRVLVFVGVTTAKNELEDPLDYQTRHAMLTDTFKNSRLEVYPITDERGDAEWSKKLDEMIDSMIGHRDTVVFYHGRDSFAEHYRGRYTEFKEISISSSESGTEQRRRIGSYMISNESFRWGVIYGTQNRWNTARAVVDAVIYDPSTKQFILGQKKGETGIRFIGGFVDVEDTSYEHAVRREVSEETGLEVGNFRYIGSARVQDWRYAHRKGSQVFTSLYLVDRVYGNAVAADDLECLIYVTKDLLRVEDFVKEHQELAQTFINQIRTFGETYGV